MPIKKNGFFNSPAMAQAAANLSSMFEPPSGADEAGYARARADNLQTGQREAMWKYMQDPEADQSLLDRAGVIADLYDPSNSYYSVNTGAATQRYGYDSAAKTSLANNAADNVRALTTNKADNQRAFLQTMFGDIGQGERRPEVTPEIADLFGIPELPEQMGLDKPLSETEWIAQQLEEAKQSGEISTGDVADTLIGKEAPVMVITQDGGISYMTPGEAARTGATPVLSSEQQKGQIIDRMTPEQQIQSILGTDLVETMGPAGAVLTPEVEAAGLKPVPKAGENKVEGLDTYTAVDNQGKERSFVGYVGDDKKVYNQATGQAETGVVRKGSGANQFAVDFDSEGRVIGIRQGAGAAKPTDKQTAAGFAGEMMEQPTKIILDAFDSGNLPAESDYQYWNLINHAQESGGVAGGAIVPTLSGQMSDQGRLFYNALQQALPYPLMVQSGQAVVESEYRRKLLAMMPLSTDDPATLASKRAAFDTAQKAINRLAGAAAKPTGDAAAPAAAPAAGTSVAKPTTQAEFDALAPGAAYVDPDDPTNEDGTPKIYTK